MTSSKAKPLNSIIIVWARVKPATPRVRKPAHSEWLAVHAMHTRFHIALTSWCQRFVITSTCS